MLAQTRRRLALRCCESIDVPAAVSADVTAFVSADVTTTTETADVTPAMTADVAAHVSTYVPSMVCVHVAGVVCDVAGEGTTRHRDDGECDEARSQFHLHRSVTARFRYASAASVLNCPPTIAADGRPSQRSSTVA